MAQKYVYYFTLIAKYSMSDIETQYMYTYEHMCIYTYTHMHIYSGPIRNMQLSENIRFIFHYFFFALLFRALQN